MALLDRIEDRRTQRLLHDLRHQAIAARDLAQDRLSELAHSAGVNDKARNAEKPIDTAMVSANCL